MKARRIACLLGFLVVSLLLANYLLIRALEAARSENAAIEDLVRRQEADLVTAHARSKSEMREPAKKAASTREPEATPQADGDAEGSFESLAAFSSDALLRRPDLTVIPFLNEEERSALHETRMEMPADISQDILLRGDVDSVLADPLWNPNGHELDPVGRAKLAGLLKDFRFFARISPDERLRRVIVPETDHLRTVGAYQEYPAGTAPPVIEGVKISHAEPSRPGFSRIYYLHEEDYPELYRDLRVEQERGIETFVKIYEAINVSP